MRDKVIKIFCWYLCLHQVLIWGGFLPRSGWAKDKNPPIGEIIIRGEVQFEAKEKIWKNIDFSYFPLFPGMKIKTKNGFANIFLKSQSHLELSKETLVLIENVDKLHLLQGKIEFRIPGPADLNLQVGKITVLKTPFRQVAKGFNSFRGGEALGTIIVHPQGSVTIKNLQGNISILDQNQQVLAALSPKDSLTIPAILTHKAPEEKIRPVKIAQVGEEEIVAEPEKYAGISAKTWGIIGLAALGATGVLIAAGGGGGGGGGGAPACP